MKQKNGFTLIELLAVIVILAVIALIAVPRIIEILNKSRLSAAEDSTYGIVEAAESYVASFMLQNQGTIPENLEFECDSTGCNLKTDIEGYNKENLEELKFKGKKPTSGAVTISNSGKNIIVNNLEINGFTCIYDGESSTCGDYKDRVVLSEEFDDKGIIGGYEGVKAIVYLDPTDLTKECNEDKLAPITEKGPNEGCMKWYVYKEDAATYTMIADHSITGNVAWNLSGDNFKGPSEVLEALKTATANWSDKLVTPESYRASWTSAGQSYSYTIDYSKYGDKARLISVEEIAEITGKDKDLNNIHFGFLDTTCGFKGCITGKSKYAWLFDNTDSCTTYGCNVEKSGNNTYWTVSPNHEDFTCAWIVGNTGILDGQHVINTIIDIRPVITIKKSDLLQ